MSIYHPDSVYRLDQAAVKLDGISEIELMGRAGRGVWNAIDSRWPGLRRISVFAGAGNNGGDAFVVALCARERGVDVQFLVQGDLERQSDTSRHYAQLWQQAGGQIETWQAQPIRGELIVDGLLGIGLQRELDQQWQELIAQINAPDLPRVAIDIPSGLNGANGIAQPVAVEADLTVTFIGRKTGQYLADGPDYCGELLFDDLGVSTRARASEPAELELLDSCRLPPPRKRNTHKNHFGHLLIVGGDLGMSGAVALAARAALRSGAGLVSALVHPECRQNLAATPEIMVYSWDALAEKLEQASVVVVGPGLGESKTAGEMLRAIGRTDHPLVVDAGALRTDFLDALESRQTVITPHPGEAAGLLKCSPAEIQADRIGSCRSLYERFNATAVLKGSGSLIGSAGQPLAINVRGNPGMASAGMGDVLSGILGALLGQGLSPHDAACSAVYLHALCADRFAREQDQIGLLASDIIEAIPRVLGQLRDAG